MKTTVSLASIVAAVALSLILSTAALAEKQTVCPVMGGKINTNLYVDFDGKRVYVCCESCLDKLKADPAGYIEKMEKAGIELEKSPVAQTVCPVTGEKVDYTKYVDVDGKRVYVCCEKCAEKVKADPATYIGKLEKDGVTLAKAPKPQTVCPVMGGAVSKSLFVDAEGKRIYVCCPSCIETVKADPHKYITQLEADGVELEKAPQ